ncbi:MAG TPA: M1 family metallopeptidase [Thermoanaerobaculia bacterium]
MSRAKGRSSLLALAGNALPSILALATSASLAAAPLTRPIASYQISCRLDAEKKVVEGTELLTWTNTTSKPAPTLQFHLYLNAFRNTLSTFWRESGGEHRGNRLPESWGSIELTRMTLADGSDLLPALTYIAPDDGNPHDRTSAEVQLPRPVNPGETISVSIDFRSRLPRVSTRTGWKGDFFLVAQWFPKIAVLEEKGWNCHQFHASSEFFADFGDYDVSIDAPARYRGKVGATGVKVEERDLPGERVLARFKQESVHDFAWTADPNYLVIDDLFREPGVADTPIHLFLEPEHRGQAGRYLKAVKTAIAGYGRVLGPYPYSTLTVVDPPWGARGAGGMEYPTLITGGTYRIAPAHVQSPESVTVHEFGHQYFYGLLASNEFEEPWLDEGFNSYMEDRVVAAAYGSNRPVLPVFGWRVPINVPMKLPLDENRRYFPVATQDALASPAWKFQTRTSYGAHVYSKTALALSTLERLIGTAKMNRALRLYADRWRFKHPTTLDWIAAVNDATGGDWRWFFDRTFFSSGAVDYAVDEARSERARTPKGLFETDGKLEEKAPAGITGARGWDSVVTVARRGDEAMPVEIVLRFEGGHTYRSAWDGEARWTKFRVANGPRLIEAVVDPGEKILLDLDRTNNGRLVTPDRRAASRWTARAVFWMQNLVDFLTLAW